MMTDQPILADSANYILTHDYEYGKLVDKRSAQELPVGDHYGDPKCGLIAPDEAWCVTGGEGLVLWFQQGDMWTGFRTGGADTSLNQLKFDRPEDKHWLHSLDETPCQFVRDVRLEDAGHVRILLDPWAVYASTWLLDIEKKSLSKVADGPSMQDQPWTDEGIEF